MMRREAKSRKISVEPESAVGESKGGCGINSNSDTNVKRKPFSMTALPRGKNSAVMIDRSRKNGNDPTPSGILDDFLNANGPLSVTIETAFPSPDKTTSELSCLSSPDLVSLFPSSETHLKNISRRSSPDLCSNRESSKNAFSGTKNLVWIKIESSNVEVSSSFCVPVSLMLQREVEMQAAARANKIGKERWTSSRIFRMWKSQRSRQQRRQERQPEHGLQKRLIQNSDYPGEIFLRMTPEVSLQNSNSSCSFRWKPWLASCIRSYYNTGSLRIPNECTGDDILLTLEYFGILTASPDDFVFDSNHVYARIQAWSRYFTHRGDLAESFLEAYDDVEAEEGNQSKRRLALKSDFFFKMTLVWILFEEIVEEDEYEYHVADGSISGSDKIIRRLRVEEVGGLYELLFGSKTKKRFKDQEYTLSQEHDGETQAKILSEEMSSRMRQDFCGYVRQSLPPWSSVQFDIERVKATPICTSKTSICGNAIVEYRPVIRICNGRPHTSESKLVRDNLYPISGHLKSVQGLASGDVVMTNHPSENQQFAFNRSVGNVSKLVNSDKNEMTFNTRNKWNGPKEIESGHHKDVLSGNESINTVGAISIHKSNETEAFNESRRAQKPIKYVNMEFGDLRSVTSVLSEPIVDDKSSLQKTYSTSEAIERGTDKKLCHGGSPVLVSAKKIVQERSGRANQKRNFIERKGPEFLPSSKPSKTSRSDFDQAIDTPPRTTRILLRTTPPWDLHQSLSRVDENKDFTSTEKLHNAALEEGNEMYNSDPLVNQGKETLESDASEWDDDNSDSKSETGPTDGHGSWGQLLASICEVLIPAPSTNTLSLSPIRHFKVSSSKSTSSTAASSDEEQQSCPCKGENETVFKPDGFVDEAKKVGNDLSNHFDELMKLAYNEMDRDSARHNGPNLLPILEEIPEILSIDKGEDPTLTSCLTSSVACKPHKTWKPDRLENFRMKNSRRLSEKMTENVAYAIPKSRSFELDPLTKCTVALPHRIDERRGPRLAHEKFSVARKKASRGDVSMRYALSTNKVFQGEKSFNHGGKNKGATGSFANEYSKENRYSRHENRFYS